MIIHMSKSWFKSFDSKQKPQKEQKKENADLHKPV